MIKITFTTILLLSTILNAQPKVNSKTYAVMLKSLLSHSVPEISVDSALQIIDSNTVILDAREPAETKVSGIKNSIPVGYDHFDLSSVNRFPKNSKIIVYCSVGYRSEKVAEKLIKSGFSDVSNLYGGIFEWVNAGQKTYKDSIVTPQIHAYNKIWGAWVNKGEKIYSK